ncbi:MAG: efflux RND transporter periplasmic adaptor subunit [Planctomycetes bacterium]|nr:efflux RND transporter periplasmic adaptor subunit [Planctomycetota bacterium]
MMKLPRIQTLMVLGIAVWLLVPQSALAQPVKKVLLAEAQLKELPATSLLVGSVRPNRISTVGAEVEGLVTALPVRQGDYLKTGTLICQLNDDTLQLELRAAEGKLESLNAAVLIAKADLDRWTREKERVAKLEDSYRANAKEVYDTLADFLIAENRVREAEQDVVEQSAQVELKKIEIAKTRIAAPFDGYVTALHTEVGQWLPRGGQVIEIIDLETVLVRVDAPESAIVHIRVGDEARVKLDALNSTVTGRVKYIIPQAHEQARTFPVDIAIANPQHTLRSGMFARCTVKTGLAGQVVAVPRDAVVHKEGTNRIWEVKPAGPAGMMAFPMVVTLGAEVGEWVAITSGNVSPGMKVAVRGNEQLMPFPAKVIVVEEEALMTTSTQSRGSRRAGRIPTGREPTRTSSH